MAEETTREEFIAQVRRSIADRQLRLRPWEGESDDHWTDEMRQRWATLIANRFMDVTDDESILPSKSGLPLDPHTGLYRPVNVGLKRGRKVKNLTSFAELKKRKREMGEAKHACCEEYGTVKQMFAYDVITGEVTRRVSHYEWRTYGKRDVGHGEYLKADGWEKIQDGTEPIRWREANGVQYVTIKGVRYYVHHIVWELHYGQRPTGNIKFLDGDKTNTRIDNLARIAGSATSMPYRARVRHLGKIVCLGSHSTPEERDAAVAEFRFRLSIGML